MSSTLQPVMFPYGTVFFHCKKCHRITCKLDKECRECSLFEKCEEYMKMVQKLEKVLGEQICKYDMGQKVESLYSQFTNKLNNTEKELFMKKLEPVIYIKKEEEFKHL